MYGINEQCIFEGNKKNIQGMRRGCNMIFAEARVLYLDHTTVTYMYCMVYILGLKKKKVG
jgi:hypothetical protein